MRIIKRLLFDLHSQATRAPCRSTTDWRACCWTWSPKAWTPESRASRGTWRRRDHWWTPCSSTWMWTRTAGWSVTSWRRWVCSGDGLNNKWGESVVCLGRDFLKGGGSTNLDGLPNVVPTKEHLSVKLLNGCTTQNKNNTTLVEVEKLICTTKYNLKKMSQWWIFCRLAADVNDNMLCPLWKLKTLIDLWPSSRSRNRWWYSFLAELRQDTTND